jgi:predicted dithiol-disulfide oxidoreductase (DUF899 family)
MFGPEYTGPCPGCSNLADHLDGGVVHLNHRDFTLLCISRAPFEKLQAYKERMGWTFPWVSSYESDFPSDFGFAFTEEQMAGIEEIQQIKQPADWLQEWAEAVGTDLESGLAEGPGWMAVVPYYHQLHDRTPKGRVDEFRAVRHNEYEEDVAQS